MATILCGRGELNSAPRMAADGGGWLPGLHMGQGGEIWQEMNAGPLVLYVRITEQDWLFFLAWL